MKTYVVGTQWKCLAEALPLSTHNICFCGEIEKNVKHFLLKKKKKSYLSRAMLEVKGIGFDIYDSISIY